MTKEDEQMQRSVKRLEEASLVAEALIEFVESKRIELRLAVAALGIAYANGSVTLGMPLPATIDLVRGFYKASRDQQNVH
jgi:hypothetical protein